MGISSILSDIKNDRNSNNKNLKDNSPPLPKIDSKEFQKVLDTTLLFFYNPTVQSLFSI